MALISCCLYFRLSLASSGSIVAMDQSDDGGDASSTNSAAESPSSSTPVSSQSEASSSTAARASFSLREQSPLKEAILTKFAKLSAPNSLQGKLSHSYAVISTKINDITDITTPFPLLLPFYSGGRVRVHNQRNGAEGRPQV